MMKKTMMTMTCIGLATAMGATEIPLWDGNMPGSATKQAENVLPDKRDDVIRLTNVSAPTLTLYPAESSGKPAPLVIICPGGGYQILSMNLEGSEIAEWLNSIGVSAGVLKYRVPHNRKGALLDARRAIRMAREHAAEWKVDSKRIGLLGFSAGGHLAAACSNSPDRPDFSVLVYPAYLFKEGGD